MGESGTAQHAEPDEGGSRLALVAPDPALAEAFFAALRDFRAAGETHIPASGSGIDSVTSPADVPTYIDAARVQERGDALPPGYVPSSAYWLVRTAPDGATEVMGLSALRHRLTPALEDVGGHIGYGIRPTARRQGYGTRILALTLDRARARGLDRALITCDTTNVASARVIERNGGILASSGLSPQTNTHVSRYWIAL